MPDSRDPGADQATHDIGAATAPALALKLVVVAGPDEGLERPLSGELVVGSGPSSDLALSDPAVSRKHARFRARAGRVSVEDLGSRNGTVLSGVRIDRADVPVGSVLTLGQTQVALWPRWHVREVRPSRRDRFGELLGESRAMREVFAILERVAPTDLSVLIEGESGTGKELAARSLHRASARRDGPFVAFDCAAVPGELAESELFGHVRGAFTGATSDRAGAFARADGGTIFLDEIGELRLDLQPKLLRVLEASEVHAVGSDGDKRVDVRVVAATNRSLAAEVSRGRFREDLRYRLEVVHVRMPPLRDRPEDVGPLVSHLLGDVTRDEEADAENLARLMAYGWPGNVRELRNVLLRARALAGAPGETPAFADLVFNLGPAAAPRPGGDAALPGVDEPLPYKEARAQLLERFERAYVEALMERHDHNVTRAAEAAGLSRKHLYDLLRKVT